jgi:hypothetical protein
MLILFPHPSNLNFLLLYFIFPPLLVSLLHVFLISFLSLSTIMFFFLPNLLVLTVFHVFCSFCSPLSCIPPCYFPPSLRVTPYRPPSLSCRSFNIDEDATHLRALSKGHCYLSTVSATHCVSLFVYPCLFSSLIDTFCCDQQEKISTWKYGRNSMVLRNGAWPFISILSRSVKHMLST